MSSHARCAASIAVVLCGVLVFAGIEKAAPVIEAAQQPSALTGDEKQARALCATCHAFPPPDILPRDAWRGELIRMMFIREGRLPPIGPPDVVNRSVQLPQDFAQVLPFYTSHAPERLPKPDACCSGGGCC